MCRNFEPTAGQLASTVRTRFVPTTQSVYRPPSDRTFHTCSGEHGRPQRFNAISLTYPISEIPRPKYFSWRLTIPRWPHSSKGSHSAPRSPECFSSSAMHCGSPLGVTECAPATSQESITRFTSRPGRTLRLGNRPRPRQLGHRPVSRRKPMASRTFDSARARLRFRAGRLAPGRRTRLKWYPSPHRLKLGAGGMSCLPGARKARVARSRAHTRRPSALLLQRGSELVKFPTSVWCRRTGRCTCMNRSTSTNEPTCPTDWVLLWWISRMAWVHPDGSPRRGASWCHRCERSFADNGRELTEISGIWPIDEIDAHLIDLPFAVQRQQDAGLRLGPSSRKVGHFRMVRSLRPLLTHRTDRSYPCSANPPAGRGHERAAQACA